MVHLQWRRGHAAVQRRLTIAGVDTRARGAMVEAAALAYLKRNGLREIATNANYRGGELDLVMFDDSARHGGSLVFVEVRYRSHAGFGGGAASITAGKRRRLVLAAQHFIAQHHEYGSAACRFDVVEADGDPQSPGLHWLRDAFRADDG